ncbi:MAG: delta-60 repeat domain-containing protein [Paraprevotella sp.]|nr:delta-60 repeat domain-containing protein [Paraprevotella sp.]
MTNTSDIQSSSYISSISAFNDGRMLISGSFSAYYSNNTNGVLAKDRVYGDNIMILTSDAQADTIGRMFWEKGNAYTGLSKLNGGATSEITRSFVTSDQKIIVVSNATQYVCNEYAEAFEDNDQRKVDVASVFRMDDTGALDSLYRPVMSGSRYSGIGDGKIEDACMDEKDGIIIVGSFTSFDGVKVPGIVRLDKDGNVDMDFMNHLGEGPNGDVSLVRYNKTLGKMMIVGGFTSFNGQERKSVVILNADGTLDEVFGLKEMTGGAPNFAQLIDREKVIVSGTFTTYDGVPRNGFLILDMDGTAQQKFNVPGVFSGQLYQVQESETTVGSYGLMLMGKINRFNSKSVHNILMLELVLDH